MTDIVDLIITIVSIWDIGFTLMAVFHKDWWGKCRWEWWLPLVGGFIAYNDLYRKSKKEKKR